MIHFSFQENCLFKFVAIVLCFTLHVFPITQTSKGPKKIIRVNENLCCRLFELSGIFLLLGGGVCVCVRGGGLVNDDVTLEGSHQMITLDYEGEGRGV